MTRRARCGYIVTKKSPPEEPIELRNVGPWDVFPTVTNDAENVVADLTSQGLLWNGRRLIYTDSEGSVAEILHLGGKFTGFGPYVTERAPRPKRLPDMDEDEIIAVIASQTRLDYSKSQTLAMRFAELVDLIGLRGVLADAQLVAALGEDVPQEVQDYLDNMTEIVVCGEGFADAVAKLRDELAGPFLQWARQQQAAQVAAKDGPQ